MGGVKQVIGGSGEIRTHERVTPLPVFKTGAFNHSATLPKVKLMLLKLAGFSSD